MNETTMNSLKKKAVLLAFCGNAYLFLVIFLAVLLLAGMIFALSVLKAIAAKLIMAVLVFLWMVIKSLWVKIPPSQGHEVSRSEAPELFGLIDELSREIEAPRFHHVLITQDLNAAVAETPRLGLFGWHRNELLIGLPLLKILSLRQFKAVLAHELGHLSKGHGRISGWIYRQRLRWIRLHTALSEQNSWGLFLITPFLKRYVPYFNSVSFPLARANEYEADRIAVRLTSAKDAAQALTGVNVAESYLSQKFWPSIFSRAGDHPQSGFAPFCGMGTTFETDATDADIRQWIDLAMAARTSDDDTHPCLSDRLDAIGWPPSWSPPGPGLAAASLLGPSLTSVTETFDKKWMDTVGPDWERHYKETLQFRERLEELDKTILSGREISMQDAYERAKLTLEVGAGPEAAILQFRELYEKSPDDPVICLCFGKCLLEKGDRQGLELTVKAMDISDGLSMNGLESILEYHCRFGRPNDAMITRQKIVNRAKLEELDRRERNLVSVKDTFEPHGLTEEELTRLRGQIDKIPGVIKVYYVRKTLTFLPRRPLFILGFTVSGPFRRGNLTKAAEALRMIHESVTFPGDTFLLNVEKSHACFLRIFRRIPGSELK